MHLKGSGKCTLFKGRRLIEGTAKQCFLFMKVGIEQVKYHGYKTIAKVFFSFLCFLFLLLDKTKLSLVSAKVLYILRLQSGQANLCLSTSHKLLLKTIIIIIISIHCLVKDVKNLFLIQNSEGCF